MIAEGTIRPLSANHSLIVDTPNPAWLQRKFTFSTSQFYEKAGAPPEGMAPPTNGSFQIDRYDTRFTKAYWNTAVPSTMPIRSGENFTEKIWNNPQEAVVHLYQTEYSLRTFYLAPIHSILTYKFFWIQMLRIYWPETGTGAYGCSSSSL